MEALVFSRPLTTRQAAQHARLDAIGQAVYARNRRAGASHAVALSLADDDQALRATRDRRRLVAPPLDVADLAGARA